MSVNKFKVGDVVKCIGTDALLSITVGKEYVVLAVNNRGNIAVENDIDDVYYYYPSRFELSGANAQQTHKFKEGDMVYLIGFNYFKPCKLTLSNCEYSHLKFKVVMDDRSSETFTENGRYLTDDTEPTIVLATEDNRQMLNRLLGIEYEPVKLTGSDLAKKLLKDKPQTCWISDVSDERAVSSSGVTLIAKFENGSFISNSGIRWKYAVPCNQHGRILEDE